jgi:hypothetical protein
MNVWPSSFPCPLIDGFAMQANAAVIRSPEAAGNTRQRRINRRLPHSISLAWVFSQAEYGQVLRWLNKNGWNWFDIQLPSGSGDHLGAYTIRLISNLQGELIEGKDGYHWRVTASAEWMPPRSRLA